MTLHVALWHFAQSTCPSSASAAIILSDLCPLQVSVLVESSHDIICYNMLLLCLYTTEVSPLELKMSDYKCIL